MKKRFLALALVLPTVAVADVTEMQSKNDIARGRYIVQLGGCNDCHTPGYAPTNGKVPESSWLIGDSLGWHGP
jgi:mono/diheme cytochrome c family protein